MGPCRPVMLTPACTASLGSCGLRGLRAAVVTHFSSWPVAPAHAGPRLRKLPRASHPSLIFFQIPVPPDASSQQLRASDSHLVGLPFAGCVHLHPGAQGLCHPHQRPPETLHVSTSGASDAALISKEPGRWACGKQC